MANSSIDHFTALMSDQAREITDVLFFAVIINAISILGSVGNVINIIVFTKQVIGQNRVGR